MTDATDLALSPEQARDEVLARELFGMRFGLARMRRLLAALDHPERSFRTIHVVGTNGKSSTTRMIAAILKRHGLRVGTYTSPHLNSFTERIEIDEQPIAPERFARAVGRALVAARALDGAAEADDHVTQFELLTAAAYFEMADRGVDVGVIEAGLGGRYDATNVIDSDVQVLTSVGLEHTRWLGETVAAIALEKLQVLREGSTLVLGADLDRSAEAIANAEAHRLRARIERAPSTPSVPVGAAGDFQLRNFATAETAAAAFLGTIDPAALANAAAEVRVPGRMQVLSRRPLTVLDGAHNPDGIKALIESLPSLGAYERLIAVVSILDDKDAAAMLQTLSEVCATIVFTTNRNPRALSPTRLAEILADQTPRLSSECVGSPRQALARAQSLAGENGAVLATGSIYLVSDLLATAEQPFGGGGSML